MSEKLVIDRNLWLRGKDSEIIEEVVGVSKMGSYLRRPYDGLMCCLGMYLHNNCGISLELLDGVSSPSDLMDEEKITDPLKQEIVHKASWMYKLFDEHRQLANTEVVDSLIAVNDNCSMEESDREKELVALFAERDIEVEFIGSRRPQEEVIL